MKIFILGWSIPFKCIIVKEVQYLLQGSGGAALLLLQNLDFLQQATSLQPELTDLFKDFFILHLTHKHTLKKYSQCRKSHMEYSANYLMCVIMMYCDCWLWVMLAKLQLQFVINKTFFILVVTHKVLRWGKLGPGGGRRWGGALWVRWLGGDRGKWRAWGVWGRGRALQNY